LQAEALACGLGLANVLFCVLAVHFIFFTHCKITTDVSFLGLLVTVAAMWSAAERKYCPCHTRHEPSRCVIFYLVKISIVKIIYFHKIKSAWRVLGEVTSFKVPTIAALHIGAVIGCPFFVQNPCMSSYSLFSFCR
jgi:hypothetical protein